MGCKAEGAAQGYTILGAVVLFLLAIQMISGALSGAMGGDLNAVIDLLLGVALIIMAVLAIDASGFIHWVVSKSGLLLALFGFMTIIIAGRSLNFDILSWPLSTGTLAGFMILIAGILLLVSKS